MSFVPPIRLADRSRRALVAAVLATLAACGCQATTDPASGDPSRDLGHADPKVRIRAARQAVQERRTDLCGLLVRNLDDADGAVRLFTAVALRKLTSEDFGYKPHGTSAERRSAVDRWRTWLASEDPPGPRSSENPSSAVPAVTANSTANPPPSSIGTTFPGSGEKNAAAMADSGDAGATATAPAN